MGRTPLYIVNSAVDAWQLTHIMGMKGSLRRGNPQTEPAWECEMTDTDSLWVDRFAQAFRATLKEALIKNQNHAYFLDSCLLHIKSSKLWHAIKAVPSNMSAYQGLVQWYHRPVGNGADVRIDDVSHWNCEHPE